MRHPREMPVDLRIFRGTFSRREQMSRQTYFALGLISGRTVGTFYSKATTRFAFPFIMSGDSRGILRSSNAAIIIKVFIGNLTFPCQSG
jgi:hypothetical protein